MLDLAARDRREVGPLWEELSEQAVGVLVRPTLPGALRMREVDLDPGRLGEEPMLGHLLAPVIGQRAAHLLRQGAHLAGEGAPDARGIFCLQRDEQRRPCRALNQGTPGRRRAPAHEQIALPMAGDRAVGHLGRARLDADHIGQLPPPLVRSARSTRPTPLVPLAQGGQQLPPQLPPRQDVQVRVDRLMRDAHRRIVRIRGCQPGGNLLRRPALGQARDHGGPQPPVDNEPPRASTPTSQPRRQPLRGQRPVVAPSIRQPAVPGAPQFPRDGAGRSAQLPGHRSQPDSRGQVTTDLLAFGSGQSRVPVHQAQLLSPGRSQDTGVALET